MGNHYQIISRLRHIGYIALIICCVLFLMGLCITVYVHGGQDIADNVVPIEPEIRSTVKSPAELFDKMHDSIVMSVDRLTHEHELDVVSVVEPTCSEKGHTIYSCSECGNQYFGNETAMLDHTWGNWVVTKYPTIKNDGVKWRKCLYCDAGEYGIVPKTTAENATNYIGRWNIPSVGVDVGLYKQNANVGSSVVDAVDSAVFFNTSHGGMVIGDHVHQGFYRIKSCSQGDAASVIYDDGHTERFVCEKVMQGHNTVKYLSDLNGNNLYEIYPGALFCYTCNETWENVTIVIFYPA